MHLNNNDDYSWILSQENQVKLILFLVNTILYYFMLCYIISSHFTQQLSTINTITGVFVCLRVPTPIATVVLHSSVFKIQLVAPNHQRLFRIFLPL